MGKNQAEAQKASCLLRLLGLAHRSQAGRGWALGPPHTPQLLPPLRACPGWAGAGAGVWIKGSVKGQGWGASLCLEAAASLWVTLSSACISWHLCPNYCIKITEPEPLIPSQLRGWEGGACRCQSCRAEPSVLDSWGCRNQLLHTGLKATGIDALTA